MKCAYLKLLPFLFSIPLFADAEQQQPKVTQYNNRFVVFLPFHQAYERIKPSAMYAGAEAFVVGSNKNQLLLNSELRFGYNFLFNRKDHLTPFAGGGYFDVFTYKDHHLRHKPGIAYGTLGILYDHEFNTIFTLGVNAKLLIGAPVNHKHFDWGSSVIGSQVGIPITFRFGRDRHWDLRLEPFNLHLKGTKATRDYAGSITTIGYRF